MKSRFPLACFCLLVVFGVLGDGVAQTFDVNGGSSSNSGTSGNQSGQTSSGDNSFSWGAGIEVARQARAADEALKRNDFASAVEHSQQAVKAAPQDAELWFMLGYSARLNSQYALSVDAYNKGLRYKPTSIRGLAGLAQTYAKMGRDKEAQQILQKVIDSNPKDADSLELAGELLLASDPKTALPMLERADALKPSAHVDLLIARAYERLGQPDQVARYINQARSRGPHDPDVLRAVAEQYSASGKYEEAIATLRSIPNMNADTQAELAYTYERAGSPQEAAAIYSRVAKAAKGNIGLQLSAAQASIAAGRPEDSTPFLDTARHIDPNNYRLHAILGSLAESEERPAEAEQEYKTALNNLPAQVQEGPLYPIELRLNLYEVYNQQNDAANAKQQLDAAAAAIQDAKVPDESRPELLRLKATVESASGNLDAAKGDLNEALALAPTNLDSLLNLANLQWKMDQKDDARATYNKVLNVDKNNKQALEGLGYLARDAGDAKLAETYFTRAVAAHPKDYAPYLALGDLYTAQRNFHAAQKNYEDAYQRMPSNPLIIAGGADASIESHNLDLAEHWFERGNEKINANTRVKLERERYLTFKERYEESAKLGFEVIEKLPNNREAVDYLAYDLYYLHRYDEALSLVNKYRPELPNDKDLPLIAGNVEVHNRNLHAALADFTKALELDPNIANGYTSRGFVLNDLKEPTKALKDFEMALKLQPDYGEAHLGLAFSDLQLERPKPALRQLQIAQKTMGKSHIWHLASAEAYRQELDYAHSAAEYRIALEEDPKDIGTQLTYADVLYRMHRYHDAIAALDNALKIAPSEPKVYALRAQLHAKMGERDATMHDIQEADRLGGNRLEILTATGDALLTLGDRNGAMQRFSRALESPLGNRIGIRLALAQIFLRQGHADEARRQIALGFAEARMFPESPVSGQDYADAANLFLAMHDFDLAENYFQKAQMSGGNTRSVGIGLTNTYLAEGDTQKAGATLAALGPASDFRDDYDYMMAAANLYRQRQDPLHSLASFARASTMAGPEDHGEAESSQYVEAEQEGRQLNDKVSFVPEGSFAPALEDVNVYALDARILKVTTKPGQLPPPRHSFQNLVQTHYRVQIGNLPVISGFIGQGLTTGRFLYPSIGVVQDRNTYDTIFNGGVNPILHFGSNSLTFNGGLQFTLRRDTISPVFMSQNLFRQFLFVYSSPFFNWISFTGSATREAGPFTDRNLRSRELFGNIEFTVGRPWGKTSLITGYSARDLLFRPFIEEYFDSSVYAGLQHKFGSRITAAILAEHLRSWRVEETQYAIAQALVPGGRFEFRASPRWSVQGSAVFSRGMGFHAYDNVQSQLLVSYVRPMRGRIRDGSVETPVSFPLHFSIGIQQQSFYDFPGSTRNTVLPVVHLTLF